MSSIQRVLIFLAFLLAISTPGFTQEPVKTPAETAREYLDLAEEILEGSKAVDDARPLVALAADLDTTFIKANYEAGRLHLMTIQRDQASKYFMRVLRQDPDYRFDIEYSIGKSYQFGEDFDRAIDYFNRYKAKLAKKPNYQGRDRVDPAVVDRAIYECENGKEFISHPKNFSIVNIGREINSEFEDYAPVINEDETEIVFTTRRREDNLNQNVADDNKPWEDIFIAKKSGANWTYAKNIGEPVNGLNHDSNTALSADGKTLFLYNDENSGDILYSEFLNGAWSTPIPLPGIINSSFAEKSVSISADEKTLYFSSNRPGGFGGLDIYKATKDSKGEWANVKNLGPKINTDLDDDGPFIDYDLVTLYFSSMGRKGMGGFDVFKSTYDPNKNDWSDPENLGYPINTPDNDIYIVFSKDNKRAYYSSVREDGMGYTDIYMITSPEGIKNAQPVVTKKPPVEPEPVDTVKQEPVIVKNDPVVKDPIVKRDPVVKEPVVKKEPEPKKEIIPIRYIVTIVDASDKTPLDAKVKLQGAKDNVLVGASSLGNGVYEFTVANAKAKDYRLSIDREGYVFVNQNLKIEGATTKEKTINRTIELRKLAVNVSGVLRNIYFDFDKATFKTESYTELNKLEAMMRQNDGMIVEISGHTDAVGGKPYNTFLSQKRAEAVKDYLTKKGIDARRIMAVGYGETKPIVSNDDEDEGREINRRVEFKVLQK
jgi:outer membrane protein OmpA-like peptidoglycan-associated protein/tetratricopeptide (TPR) repeat protein